MNEEDEVVHLMVTSTDKIEVLALVKKIKERLPDIILEILMSSEVDELKNEPLLLIKTLCDEELLYNDEYELIKLIHLLMQKQFDECIKYVLSKYEFTNLVIQRLLCYCRDYDLDVQYGEDDWIEEPEEIEYDKLIPLLVDCMSEEINADNLIEIALTSQQAFYKMNDTFCHIVSNICLSDVADYIANRE